MPGCPCRSIPPHLPYPLRRANCLTEPLKERGEIDRLQLPPVRQHLRSCDAQPQEPVGEAVRHFGGIQQAQEFLLRYMPDHANMRARGFERVVLDGVTEGATVPGFAERITEEVAFTGRHLQDGSKLSLIN